MKRGLGLIYRYKFKITIISICLMTFMIGSKFVGTGSQQHQHLHLQNEFEQQQQQRQQILKNRNDNELIKEFEKLKSKSEEQENKINQQSQNLILENLKQNQQNVLINLNIQNKQSNDQIIQNTPYEKILKNMERIIHIDLKGAPLKPQYFEKFFSLLKEFGATGILLEYEDVFPYEGGLAEAKHGHAYSIEDVKKIKNLAKQNGLKIIPLVQTYGHLEWLLKVKKFAHLREVYEYPQVITPCLEESYTVLFDMIDQVIKLHDDVQEFHVGCDEVYYKLAHEKCANYPFKNDFAQAFMNHLIKIAKHVRSKLPKAKIIFWDDMMHGMEETSIMQFKKDFVDLEIEPMLWGYMEDVASYFPSTLYEKYGRVFGKIWIATAYKGASGELATLTSIEHHYQNHLSWLRVMNEKVTNKIVEFKGVAITGWSRYDHFLTLCDLLPEAIPSLVFNLQLMQYGVLTDERKNEITKKLGCTGQIPWYGKASYPITCTFPGHEVYEAILPLEATINTYKNDMDNIKKYISPMNYEYSYLHKKRTSEMMEKLNYNYMAMITFKNRFLSACESIFWEDTANEWLLVYFVPYLDELYNIMVKVKNASSQNEWKPRPLPITLKQYPNNF